VRDHPIVITESDAVKLRGLLAARTGGPRYGNRSEDLAAELDRALIAEPGDALDGLVTMHARVQVLDVASGKRRELELVYPDEADLGAGRISVLAPLGTALLGCREGDEVEWEMPGGLKQMRIERVSRPSAPAEEFLARAAS